MVPIQPWLLGMSMLLGMPNAADTRYNNVGYSDESTEWLSAGYWLTFLTWMVQSELKWWSYNLLASPLRTLLWHVSNYISTRCRQFLLAIIADVARTVDQAWTVVSNTCQSVRMLCGNWQLQRHHRRAAAAIGDDRLALKDVEADDPHDVEVGARKYYFTLV